MNISTRTQPRSVGSNLASRALSKMASDNVRTVQDQCRIGLQYNERIQSESTDHNEKLVAQVSRKAYDACRNVYSAYSALKTGFQNIQSDVSGPATKVLARVGKEAVFGSSVRTLEDQDRIGLRFMEAERDISTGTEKAIAEAALKAYSRSQTASSGLGVLTAGLTHLAAGVGGAVGPALAAVGKDAVWNKHVSTLQDQDRIGLTFMKSIEEKTAGAEQAVARTVVSAYEETRSARSGLGVLNSGLSAVAAGIGGPVGSVLAEVGLASMYNNNVASVQDQCRIGLEFTKSVGQNDESLAKEADFTLELYRNSSSASLGLEHLRDFLKEVKGPGDN